MTGRLQNYIGGAFVDSESEESIDIINPADESVVAVSPVSTAAEVSAAIDAAENARIAWGTSTPKTRADVLLKLADAVEEHADEIVAAQIRNTGQLRAFVKSEEVLVSADQLRFFAGAARLLEGKSAGEYMEGFTSYIRREPIGIVGQVTPWNYPFMMAIWKIGPALAAGNTIVLKPSDTTPESTIVLARISQGIIPDGVFNVVLGTGATGAQLVSDPRLGLVSITGSVRAGIAVAAAAAADVKRAHLELGGKAPAVVFADADVEAAASGIAEAAFFNAGQDCTAATRAIVHTSVYARFVQAVVAKAATLRPGGVDDEDAFYGPLNNIRHFTTVTEKIAALPDHAKIETGGTRVGDSGFYFAPTIITGVNQDDAIVQEETFGPILTVQTFDDEDDAVAKANGVDYGLAASVWASDNGTVNRMTARIDAGCVWVNGHIPLVVEMPHGGFKHSGYGKDMSAYGVEDYTRIKHVMSANT